MTAASEQWRDLGRGTGKRPDGVSDDDVVRWRNPRWFELKARSCAWDGDFEYELLVRTPAEPDVLRELIQDALTTSVRCTLSENWLRRARDALAATEPTKEVM